MHAQQYKLLLQHSHGSSDIVVFGPKSDQGLEDCFLYCQMGSCLLCQLDAIQVTYIAYVYVFVHSLFLGMHFLDPQMESGL